MANYVSEDYISVKFDIARFGSMMYEVSFGSRYEFYVVPEIETDVEDDAEFKPNTNDVFFGDLIRKCWADEGFRTMLEVCHALDNADQKPAALTTPKDAEKAKLN
ncbi:hypothetical protein HFD88_007468 [Aspergillus terreus]|nr:hypothetical protein HFD88_007468 [Aspergillus terreus]